MSLRVAFSSSVSNADKSIPAAAKASSVGAKTVNGPSPCRVVTRSAWASAATRELWIVVALAVIAMSTAGVQMYASHSAWLTIVKVCVTML